MTLKPLPGKTKQRLFCTQNPEPRTRLFRPVRACETGFSPGWETDPLQAPKARIRPCVGKVEKSPNIASKEGVKKKQVKGCGSVNRPTPGSQRPAEPVASGFSQGSIHQFLWVSFGALGSGCGSENKQTQEFRGKSVGQAVGLAPKIQMGGTYDRRKKQSA